MSVALIIKIIRRYKKQYNKNFNTVKLVLVLKKQMNNFFNFSKNWQKDYWQNDKYFPTTVHEDKP